MNLIGSNGRLDPVDVGADSAENWWARWRTWHAGAFAEGNATNLRVSLAVHDEERTTRVAHAWRLLVVFGADHAVLEAHAAPFAFAVGVSHHGDLGYLKGIGDTWDTSGLGVAPSNYGRWNVVRVVVRARRQANRADVITKVDWR